MIARELTIQENSGALHFYETNIFDLIGTACPYGFDYGDGAGDGDDDWPYGRYHDGRKPPAFYNARQR